MWRHLLYTFWFVRNLKKVYKVGGATSFEIKNESWFLFYTIIKNVKPEGQHLDD